MSRKRNIEILRELDGLRPIGFDSCKCFVHDQHRWLLPLVYDAGRSGILSTPCTVVSFDAHHDTVEPTEDCMKEIKEIRQSGLSVERLVFLCKDKLRLTNDDWIRAGMELGLISDVVVFGVQQCFDTKIPRQYADHTGMNHRIEICGLPPEELGRGGRLGASHDHRQPRELWDILDWNYEPQKGFAFGQRREKIVLDFDLDCFTLTCLKRKYTFPWPDEVFEKELLADSHYYSTEGWSGKAFVQQLIDRAGLVVIAREERCCGDQQKADKVLRKLNHLLFDDRLRISWRCTNCGHIYKGSDAGDCTECGTPDSRYEMVCD